MTAMRMLVLLACVAGTPALPDAYFDLGQPGQCGTYAEAAYDRDSWFAGGESGLIGLRDPQSVRGLNALLFEGTLTEEGENSPAGRVLATRGTLRTAGEANGAEVVVIVTEGGIRVLQRCP